MVDRIRALLALRQLTPTQLADLLQVGRPIISHILSGRNKASLEVVQRIIAAFPEVALPWLLGGTGPMLSAAPVAAAVEAPIPTLISAVEAAQLPAEVSSQKPFLAAIRRQVATPGSKPEALAQAPPTYPTGQTLANNRQPQKFKQPGQNVGTGNPPKGATLVGAGDSAANPSTVASAAVAVGSPGSVLTDPASQDISAPTAAASVPKAGPLPNAPVSAQESTLGVNSPLFIADKPIRRIVIFYRDGSFSDFQPEG